MACRTGSLEDGYWSASRPRPDVELVNANWLGDAKALAAGTNCVTTDAAATGVIGYDPMTPGGTLPFDRYENTLALAERVARTRASGSTCCIVRQTG